MVREDKSTWKANYFVKLAELLEEYPRCFIVGADNVGSKQMQEIRIALRGQVCLKFTLLVQMLLCPPCKTHVLDISSWLCT